jgi:putative glutamine amidotransferase
MSRRPVIGIATQTLEAVPGELPPCWIMGQRYVHALRSVGAIPWLIPLLPDDLETLKEIYDRLDGMFFTGGVDVDPSRYGEAKLPHCGRTDLPRDDVETQLIRWSLADRKPVLAVCRGIQILNVAMGGSLFQDIAAQAPTAMKHDYFPTEDNTARDFLAHAIEIAPDSRLRGFLGSTSVRVNSMHHQAIKRLAPGLRQTAVAPDGIIEGVEGANGQYLIGVQWHPEELSEHDPAMRRLFASFIDAAE